MKPLPLILSAAAAAALPAVAHEAGTLTYPEFEVSVPHIDLAECPPGLAEGDVFCRLTLSSEALHVYVFEAGGEQAFVRMRSFHAGEFELRFSR